MAAASIHGYSDQISARPGDRVRVMVSCEGTERYRADLVRLIHGDTNPAGPGYKEEVIASGISGEYPARHLAVWSGSHVLISDPAGRLDLPEAFTLFAFIWPTTPGRGEQGVLTRWWADRQAGYALAIDAEGRLALWLGDEQGRAARLAAAQPLLPEVWYAVGATFDAASGRASLFQQPVVNRTNSRWARFAVGADATFANLEIGSAVPRPSAGGAPFVIAGFAQPLATGGAVVVGHYNGKVDRPRV